MVHWPQFIGVPARLAAVSKGMDKHITPQAGLANISPALPAVIRQPPGIWCTGAYVPKLIGIGWHSPVELAAATSAHVHQAVLA